MRETSQPSRTTRAEAPRRTWARPTLTHLSAASAEFNVGATDDGPDLS